jgi:hypothetical protein
MLLNIWVIINAFNPNLWCNRARASQTSLTID